MLAKKIQEDTEQNQETQAQNEYLRKQLGIVLKQKQKTSEETFQYEPRRQEQVFSQEVDSSSDDEPIIMGRAEQWFQASTNDFKVEVPQLKGKLDAEEFLNWLHTGERVLEYKDVPEDKEVKMVASRLRKYASLQWTNRSVKWVRERKPRIHTWDKMKSKHKARFLPPTYV